MQALHIGNTIVHFAVCKNILAGFSILLYMSAYLGPIVGFKLLILYLLMFSELLHHVRLVHSPY